MKHLPPEPPCGVSVIICSYRGNEYLLHSCLEGIRAQEHKPGEVVLVVDTATEADEYRGLLTGFSDLPLRVIASGKIGLSAARNAGITSSRGDILVFLDDDAVPVPGWLRHLVSSFGDPAVFVTGGPVLPRYTGRPLPDSLAWIVGCTGETIPAMRPIGCNMAFRREVFAVAGQFDEGLGRVRDNQAIGEETEIILRLARAMPGSRVVMEPGAIVMHHVPARRTTYSYIIRRAWQEGLAKGRISLQNPVRTERAYLSWYLRHPRLLPLFVLAITGAGFLRGRFSSTL